MRRIACFVLAAALFAASSGCSSQNDKAKDILTDTPATINENAEDTVNLASEVEKEIGDNENTAGDDTEQGPESSIDNKINDIDDRDLEGKNVTDANTNTEKASSKTAVQDDEKAGKAESDLINGDSGKSSGTTGVNNGGAEGKNGSLGGNGGGTESKSVSTSENSGGTETSSGVSGSNSSGASVKGIVEKQGLVELIKLDDSFVIDIKYATEDNFAKKKIYSMPLCLIHKNTAQKLIAANNEFKTLGYRIKVFDAYRPYSAQQVLWDSTEDKSYLADPKKGSKHNRGAAVDITLVDENGQELPMPSGYDEFSERAHLKYDKCDEELIKNRELLGKIMVKHGFKRISTEWWHFDDVDASNYPLLDVSFEQFIDEN